MIFILIKSVKELEGISLSAAYLFMFGSVLAVISILIVFKMFIDKVKRAPEDRNALQSKFFVGVAIAEVIPIILIVFGFIMSQPVALMGDLLLPAIIIILSMAFAPFFIFLQTKVDVTKETKGIVTTLAFIGVMLTLSLPIVSLIGLLLLLPK